MKLRFEDMSQFHKVELRGRGTWIKVELRGRGTWIKVELRGRGTWINYTSVPVGYSELLTIFFSTRGICQ